jgi:hypothetical protein
MAVFPNTLGAAELWVSPPLVAEARWAEHLEVTGPVAPLPFDGQAKLMQERLFPQSVRGRRSPASVS